MSTRIKKTLPKIISRTEAESLVNELALTILNQRKIIADRDAELLAVEEDYADGLAECQTAIDAGTEALHVWAEANPAEFPTDVKSIAFPAGDIGFRTGNPKLETVSRSITWKAVLNKMLTAKSWSRFIRRKPEIDKESILARYSRSKAKPNFDKALKRFGLAIVQDEVFFVEPNLTDLETRQTSETK